MKCTKTYNDRAQLLTQFCLVTFSLVCRRVGHSKTFYFCCFLSLLGHRTEEEKVTMDANKVESKNKLGKSEQMLLLQLQRDIFRVEFSIANLIFTRNRLKQNRKHERSINKSHYFTVKRARCRHKQKRQNSLCFPVLAYACTPIFLVKTNSPMLLIMLKLLLGLLSLSRYLLLL